MRCLHCHCDVTGDVCPQCNVYLPSLLRDVLPAGTSLHNNAYRIDDVLGRGGFGITYRATHLALQDPVAIKEFYPVQYVTRDSTTGSLLVSAQQQEDFVQDLQRFKEEGYCLKDLDHPGIVRVRDMFEERDTIYLVMKFIRGRTLRQELDAQADGKLAAKQVKKIVEKMVVALETIHRENIYHLDIKPENVLITNDGNVVLIDFGAARRKSSANVRPQFDLNYAAPEIFTHQTVGPESDLYELGMLVHELLTGKRPLSAFECLMENKTPELSPNLENPWQTLLKQALALRKEDRSTSVQIWWEMGWHTSSSISSSRIPVSSKSANLSQGAFQTRSMPIPGTSIPYASQKTPQTLFPALSSTPTPYSPTDAQPLPLSIPRVLNTYSTSTDEKSKKPFKRKAVAVLILATLLVLASVGILLALALRS